VVPNDVYLTYSIFMLTSTLRITVLPLNLQVEPTKTHLNFNETTGKAPKEQSEWLEPSEGPAPYVSFLGEPYTPHTPQHGSGLPPLPKLSLSPGSSSKEFMLTPDTLRYIGKIVEQITGQIQELHVAQRAAEGRVQLQQEELNRQVAKCRELEQTMARLKQTASQTAGPGSRLERVEETQKGLMKRFDRLLQGLMAKASPELSEQERKWFEELKRMKEEILGRGKYDEGAIVARVKLVCSLTHLA
jgi:nucleoporin NUP82